MVTLYFVLSTHKYGNKPVTAIDTGINTGRK